MKLTVEKLIAQLTDLKVEEREIQKRLDENRQRQAAIMSSLQVKPEPTETARRQSPAKSGKRAAVTGGAAVRPSPLIPASPSHAEAAKYDSERIRDYIRAAPDDALITTEAVAKSLQINPSTVSTALSRMTGKLIERAPGTKRGKFHKINRAA